MRHHIRQVLGLFQRFAHWLFPIGALVIGLGIGVIRSGEEDRLLFAAASTEPELIALKDLLARGANGNPNLLVKDFALSDNFVAEEFAGQWTMAWVAAIPPEDLPPGQIKAGALATAPVLIYTSKAGSRNELFALCDKARLQVLVANGVMSLDAERQKKLRQTFAGMEVSRCLLLAEGRRPPGLAQVLIKLGGGSLLVLAGTGLAGFFFLTLWKEYGFKSAQERASGLVSQGHENSQQPLTVEEAQRQLGDSEAVFKPGMENLVAGIVLGLLMIVAGTGVCLYLLYKTLKHWAQLPVFGPADDALWPYLLFAAVCPLLAAGGGFVIWYVRLLHGFRVLVCPRGLISVWGTGVRVFPWDDIASVKETIVQEYLPLKSGLKYVAPMGKARSFVVSMKNRSTFSFDGDWVKKPGRLAKVIKKETDARGVFWDVVQG